MAAATPQAVRAQIARGKPDLIYLIVGDDDAETSRLAADLSGLVEDELRAFNLERLYAGEKGGTPASIVQAARTLPMAGTMGGRRVVIVLRAERIFKPKRRGGGKAQEKESDAAEDLEAQEPPDAEQLDAYVRKPEPLTTLVLMAADVDRSRKLYKSLQKHATIVECWGLRVGKDARVDLRQVARQAEVLVKHAVTEAGQQIDPAAARLIAERAGTDISTLRGDVSRLLLYAAGKERIDLKDVQELSLIHI